MMMMMQKTKEKKTKKNDEDYYDHDHPVDLPFYEDVGFAVAAGEEDVAYGMRLRRKLASGADRSGSRGRGLCIRARFVIFVSSCLHHHHQLRCQRVRGVFCFLMVQYIE